MYIASWDKKVYALSTKTGEKIWEFVTGGPITGTPRLVWDNVLIGSFDTYLYCLAAKTGELIWKFKTKAFDFPSKIMIPVLVKSEGKPLEYRKIEVETSFVENIYKLQSDLGINPRGGTYTGGRGGTYNLKQLYSAACFSSYHRAKPKLIIIYSKIYFQNYLRIIIVRRSFYEGIFLKIYLNILRN